MLRSQSDVYVVLASAVVLNFAAVGRSLAQTELEPQARALKTLDLGGVQSVAIFVDGALDEPAWQSAATIGELVQREPESGARATEITEVRLLRDEGFLYIGVICFDSAADAVIGTQMARDASLDDDDRVEIVLDTFRDRRNAFYFATNPAGALVDGLVVENRNLNLDWDAVWDVRTARTDAGWTAEFSIPFKSLRFRADQAVWGFNFSRTIKRKIEEDRWAGASLDLDFLQISEAGEITGLGDISQGIGLDVRPFIAAHSLRDETTGTTTSEGDPGLDVFYNVTPNLKISATFNTDFAETEVDARQINLTRFPLFFPEKRSFFLENAANFSFSNTGLNFRNADQTVMPFFSRRIGLLRGEEVPILAGAQLTGKVGQTDIGLLDVRTDDSPVTPAQNFFVGRVKQNILRQSYVGGIYTAGNPEGNADSSTFGADFRYSTSQFLGTDRNFVVDVFGLRSRNEGASDEDSAYGFTVAYPNDLLDLSLTLREVQQNFRPALGFVPRPNVRTLFISADYSPRPRDFLNIRQMFHEFRYTETTRLDYRDVESRRLFVAPINWQFNSGDRVELNWVPTYERLFEPFEISEGVTLAPGDYRFTRWRLEAFSASRRRFEVRATWWLGTYWSGRADEVELSLRYKLPPRFVVNFSTEQTFAELPQGDFVARVNTVRVDYALSPFLTFFNLIQYDNASRNLGWQSRIRWTLDPGTQQSTESTGLHKSLVMTRVHCFVETQVASHDTEYFALSHKRLHSQVTGPARVKGNLTTSMILNDGGVIGRVVDAHHAAFGRQYAGKVTRTCISALKETAAVFRHELRGMTMVGGHEHQRPQMCFRIVKCQR
jgi:hypothetical protein